ncbi:hypothetical protein [Erythrobacter donghaensis]|uniref:hypothetical protein n=1 Tax=Erythrobacter donghaensis TaxID=267135 RepID=UPI000A38C379|nr:hypothetical protein [Erythrobacter donghaensis]
MIHRLTVLLIALCLALPASAAEWLRAESEHYVVHAQMNEADLGALVQYLEDFGEVLDIVLPGETTPGRKLELYLAANASEVSRVTNLKLSGVGAGGAEVPVAYVAYDYGREPKRRAGDLLFYLGGYHLSHKFFRPHPVWVRFGFSDFFRTTWRDENGDFILGEPPPAIERRRNIAVPDLRMALAARTSPDDQAAFDRFYQTSAAMVAPLLIEPEQRGVLARYLDAYVSGAPMEVAGETLGDPEALAKVISRRKSARTVPMRRVTLPARAPAAVSITPMSADAAALVEVRIERLLDERREAVSGKLATLTGQFPDSAPVWYEYAAAEFARVQAADFGGLPLMRGFGFANGELIVTANRYSDAEAWRAVNQALALDADHAQARRLKAEIMLGRLVRAGEEPAPDEWDAVRALLEPLAADPQAHPLAAALSYQSWIEQGLTPPDTALDRLGRAFVANAGVADFRYAYAVALARAGKGDVARMLLTSMLNHPEFAEAATRALEEAR